MTVTIMLMMVMAITKWKGFKAFKKMKKLLHLLCLGALTFVACEKELSFVENNEPETIVLTFSAERPQLEPSTRTAWDSDAKAIVWTNGDKIRAGYTLNGAWMGKTEAGTARFYASTGVDITENESIGTFNVPGDFTDPEADGKYQFFAIYPSSLIESTSVSDPSALTVSLSSNQTPGSNTFDPKTDIMVGKSSVETLSGLPTDPIHLKWVRLVGHADLTFSNINGFVETENVRSITLTFNEEAKVAGSFSIDIPNRTAGPGSENSITLGGNNFTVVGTSVKTWASVLPTTFTALSVEIKTDKAIYTRSISGFSREFLQNRRNILTVNMASAQRTEVEPDRYVLYSGALTEGDYLICYNNGAMKAAVESNRLKYEAVYPVNDVILSNDPSIVWHIAPSGDYWTIYNADVESYAAATNAKNQAQLLSDGADDKSLWSVSGTTTYDFVNKARAASTSNPGNKFLRRNGDNGYACYSGEGENPTGGPLSLYKKDTRTRIPAPASVSASVNSEDDHVIDVSFSTVTGAASYVIIATPTNGGSVVTKDDVPGSPAAISTTDGLAYSTEYSISVYAVPVNTTQYFESIATEAEGTVTTGQDNEGARWELVSSISDIVAGEKYLLATNDKANVYNGAIIKGHLQVVAVTPENNKISASELPTNAVQIEFVSAGPANAYYLKVGSNYISATKSSSGNFKVDGSTPFKWSFSNATSGGGLIASGTVDYESVYIRSYENNSFRSYNGLQGESIYLYKLVGDSGITVETPSISPAGGTFTSAQTVSISCGTTGATIYYTLDGTDPNNSSSVYSAPLTVSSTTTVKAIAIKDGTSSSIASATYTISTGTEANPYTVSQAIARAQSLGSATLSNVYVKGIVCTSGSISSGNLTYYISETGSSSDSRFELYKGKYLNGNAFTESTILKVGDYVIVTGTLTYYSNSQAELTSGNEVVSVLRAPTFSPSEESFTNSLTISLNAETGAIIKYTIDGVTNPSENVGITYNSSSPISISGTTTIKAIAIKDGAITGVVSKMYTKVSSGSATATYVFNTDAGLSALGITKPSAGNATNLTGSYTVDGVTMSATHGNTDTRVYNSNGATDLRIYKNGGSLTFSVGSGKNIESIVLAGSATANFSAQVGTFSNGTWSGSANSVTLTATNTGKINTISITYN